MRTIRAGLAPLAQGAEVSSTTLLVPLFATGSAVRREVERIGRNGVSRAYPTSVWR